MWQFGMYSFHTVRGDQPPFLHEVYRPVWGCDWLPHLHVIKGSIHPVEVVGSVVGHVSWMCLMGLSHDVVGSIWHHSWLGACLRWGYWAVQVGRLVITNHTTPLVIV